MLLFSRSGRGAGERPVFPQPTQQRSLQLPCQRDTLVRGSKLPCHVQQEAGGAVGRSRAAWRHSLVPRLLAGVPPRYLTSSGRRWQLIAEVHASALWSVMHVRTEKVPDSAQVGVQRTSTV